LLYLLTLSSAFKNKSIIFFIGLFTNELCSVNLAIPYSSFSYCSLKETIELGKLNLPFIRPPLDDALISVFMNFFAAISMFIIANTYPST
jgi:hypothetical protein